MFYSGRGGLRMSTMITIPLEDYAKLVEYRARINIAYGVITAEHENCIAIHGEKARCFDAGLIETVLGYMENENHFETLKKNFRNKENEDGR
jgi:hypothetical protein